MGVSIFPRSARPPRPAGGKKGDRGVGKELCVFKNSRLLFEQQMKITEQVPEYIRSLIPYEPGKPIEEVEREYGIADSVKLASNENPLGPSPKALAAMRNRLDQLHLYPDGDCYYLKNRLAKKLGVAPDQVIFGNGSNEIIELAARTFLRPGDEAVMAEQAFVGYQLIVQTLGGKSKQVPLKNFTPDLGAIAAGITANTRIL